MSARLCAAAGLLALLASVLAVPALSANTPKEKLLGTYGSWRAYAYDEGGQTVCYMVTTKILKTSAAKKRATPYLMITHRPIEASRDVVSYGAGTLLDSKHGVKLRVGKASFDLFSVRDTAWARDSLTDHKIAASVLNAPYAQISGIGTKKDMKIISDRFDLLGANSAYHAIGKACGLLETAPKKPTPKKPVAAPRKKLH